jgi:hypothetical protein
MQTIIIENVNDITADMIERENSYGSNRFSKTIIVTTRNGINDYREIEIILKGDYRRLLNIQQ